MLPNLTDKNLLVRKTGDAINLRVISQVTETNARVAIRTSPILMVVTGRKVPLIGPSLIILTGITKTGPLVLITVLKAISQAGQIQVRNARSGRTAPLMIAGQPAEIPAHLIGQNQETTVGRRKALNANFRWVLPLPAKHRITT
jgi:hypothetical protein